MNMKSIIWLGDPYEERNLANPQYETEETKVVRLILQKLLAVECEKKRIYPSTGQVPGKPSCKTCGPEFLNV